MGPRYIESDENTKFLYIDANNLYRWAMSQYLPTGDCKKIKLYCEYDSVLKNEIKEDILNTPDDNEYGYFVECALEYPAEIREKPKTFHFDLIKQIQELTDPSKPIKQIQADPELFTTYMNSVKQPNYKPTEKLMCYLTNKQKYMIHYRMFKFYTKLGMKVTKINTIYRFKQSLWLE